MGVGKKYEAYESCGSRWCVWEVSTKRVVFSNKKYKQATRLAEGLNAGDIDDPDEIIERFHNASN